MGTSAPAPRSAEPPGAVAAAPVARESIGGEALLHVTPLVRELPAQLTPLRALASVERRPGTVFLESGGGRGDADAAGGEEGGDDWTLLAFDPVRSFAFRAGVDTAEALGAVFAPPVVFTRDIPAPFASGLAGIIAYDAKDFFERYPARARRDSALPDVALGFYDVVWAWERRSGRGWAIATGLPERDPGSRAVRARARLEEQWGAVVGAASPGGSGRAAAAEHAAAATRSAGPGAVSAPEIASNFTRASYAGAVERALEHIAAGDIYQVNLAQRFQVTPAPRPEALFRSLREHAPAPFSAYVAFDGGGIACSSPERFFRIRGDRIETWPIKGTRPRGSTAEEDAVQAVALRASAKDRAENVMIVDLERNDLGRVCAIGSVRVAALWDVASYSNVHHLVSRVEGRLRPDVGPGDVLRAVFPGGSITGAPKIRAIEIIDALEPTRRGVYTGSIGYWDVRGSCDWNIAIRTIVVEGGAASFHAGGGIVADSTPSGEYEETLIKASGMLAALGVRWGG